MNGYLHCFLRSELIQTTKYDTPIEIPRNCMNMEYKKNQTYYNFMKDLESDTIILMKNQI
ncbi:hypothetical protein D8M03_14075 [Lysinibacillus endophyticus]|uniref:Uncharacterized protein n=1 Tax=Ureibacillus endophyticus TaxID=1978490 RepID=A0A494YW39_9BACL|nr:hypothetical protein D8M03_14075 [Lysinibacillus endophyticus]